MITALDTSYFNKYMILFIYKKRFEVKMIIEYFKEFPNIVAGITTRKFGNCSNKLIIPNQIPPFHQKLMDLYQMDSLTTAKLIHTDVTLNINKDDLSLNADAFITDQANQLIAVTTADCIPVFLYDPTTIKIGIVHSGRVGLQKKITVKSIQKMIEDFHISLTNLQIQIGPHICHSCYEVGADILKEFNIACPTEKGYLPMEDILIDDLLELGIPSQNIRPSDYCTHCTLNSDGTKKFYSYRNNGEMERILSFIGIKK